MEKSVEILSEREKLFQDEVSKSLGWHEQARAFELAARQSGRFAWLGVVQGRDTLGHNALVFFLVQIPLESRSASSLAELVDLDTPFVTLAMAMRSRFFLQLYYIRDATGTEVEWQKRAMTAVEGLYVEVHFLEGLALV